MTIGESGEPAATSESVQPPEAGAEANGGSPAEESQGGFGDLYDLSAAPEELRPYLEQELKKVESNVHGKLRDAAEFRKQWEPLGQVEGLTDVDPESLSELVKLHELSQDSSQFLDWWGNVVSGVDPNDPEQMESLEKAWEQVGEQHGFFDESSGADGEDDDFGDGFDGVEGDEPPAWAQEMMEKVERLEQGNSQSQEEQRKAEAQKWIEGERKRLDPEGDKIGDEDWEVVCRLSMAYDVNDDKAIEKGYADFQKIKGNGQEELVDQANARPGPSTSGGQPDASPEKFEGLDDPKLKAAARARFAGKV